MAEANDPRKKKLADEVWRDFREMSGDRVNWETHWEEIAELLWPEQKHTFRPGIDYVTPGEKKTERQLDATPQIALHQFGAILDSLLTPRNQTWHRLVASDENLNRDREVQLWFGQVTKALFQHRYAPSANFTSNNQMVYKSLGAWGTGVLFVDQALDAPGLRYKACPLGQNYIRENHQGIVNTVLRYYPLRGHQVTSLIENGQWTGMSDGEKELAKNKPEQIFWFIHRVQPNRDRDPRRKDAKGMEFESVTISVKTKDVLKEGGYNSFPYAVTRYEQDNPEEKYGRSPAMMALPAMKTLNAVKKTLLKQGHRVTDPVLLTHDDGILNNISLKPGAINPGGVSGDGRLLVRPLPTGNIAVGEDMANGERAIVNMAFLVHLFQILTDTPRMTATEVIERTREKGILLAPTVGRQQSEYLGPVIDREIDLLAQQFLIPPMPPLLREARGEYTIQYDSPLSKAMRAQEAAGLIRTVEHVLTVVNVTGDLSPLDNFDMDIVTREIADIQAVPVHWMRALEDVQAIRQGRAEAQERQMQAQEAPGQAALVNAEAKAQKVQAT